MFSRDFYPTAPEQIEQMLAGFNVTGKVCCDPEGGKGDIVDYLQAEGAGDVISCEINADLRKILSSKCRVIADDFLTVTSDMVSHVDFFIMNPPFSADEKHILHAFDIAPAGCNIISLANLNTIENEYTESRRRLRTIIEDNDFLKALCYLTGDSYDGFDTLSHTISYRCRMKYKGTDTFVKSEYGDKPASDYSIDRLKSFCKNSSRCSRVFE